MIRDPILLEEGETLEEGCLPCVKYQLSSDRFSVVRCRDVVVKVKVLVNFVVPSCSD